MSDEQTGEWTVESWRDGLVTINQWNRAFAKIEYGAGFKCETKDEALAIARQMAASGRMLAEMETAKAKIAAMTEHWPEFTEGLYSIAGSLREADGTWAYDTEAGEMEPYPTKEAAIEAWLESRKR